MQTRIFDEISKWPIVPTVFPCAVDALCDYAQVLSSEGYGAIELLSRPPADALDVFRQICERPERQIIKWGIGTIRTADTARQFAQLRPDFFVSPAFSRRVLAVAVEVGIPYIPGVQSFQDVQDAIDTFDELGLTVKLLKLCPIFNLSEDYVSALCSCFPGIQFCPTGEISWDNYQSWKQQPGIVAPMGSGLVPHDLIVNGDVEAIRARLQALRQMADGRHSASLSADFAWLHEE